MYYSEDALATILTSLRQSRTKATAIMQRYAFHRYRTDLGREFATHGFSRRLAVIMRCLENVFTSLPPDLESIPERTAILDATINIQTIVFNTFGCLDNLARVWVEERPVLQPSGLQIPPQHIGMRKVNTTVRNSFSDEFKQFIETMDDWIDNYLENFRHSLAHRIPLYIPPHSVLRSNNERYVQLEAESNRVLLQEFNVEAHQRILLEMQGLTFFQPHMTHSFSENAPHMVIHPQILADIETILEIAEQFMAELETIPPSA